MNWRQLKNLPVMWLLRSPFHRQLSRYILLITFRGRKTGCYYTTPVNYVRNGDALLIVSSPDRSWWRNLVGGAPVRVLLKGQSLKGFGEALTAPADRLDAFVTLLRRSPRYRKHFDIVLTPVGQPADMQAVQRLADERIIVRLVNLRASDTSKERSRSPAAAAKDSAE